MAQSGIDEHTVVMTAADSTGESTLALSVAQAAARVGLTPATLRTWDRRYGLAPSLRTPGGHRRYSAADLERLRTAARLLQLGHPAAEACAAPAGAAGERGVGRRRGGGRVLPLPDGSEAQRGLARAAVALDATAITDSVAAMIRDHGVAQTWSEVLSPVLAAVGQRWAATGTGVEVEHVLAGAITRALMATMPAADPDGRPVLLACMPDEEHCLPLLALQSALIADGTHTILLGARVPVDSLIEAVRRLRPSRVGLWSQLPSTADAAVPAAIPDMRPPTEAVLLGPGWLDAAGPRSLDDAAARMRLAG